jgi:tetratricopeptide (TPR) repeat protein
MCETNYGNWLMEKGRDAEAVPHFENSLRLKSENVPALLNLARIADQGGRPDAAAGYLRAALRIDPLDTTVLINLGAASTRAGKPADAIAAFEEALRLGAPERPVAENGLGAALLQAGRTDEAIGHFREALRLDPDYAFARANRERALSVSSGPGLLSRRPPGR